MFSPTYRNHWQNSFINLSTNVGSTFFGGLTKLSYSLPGYYKFIFFSYIIIIDKKYTLWCLVQHSKTGLCFGNAVFLKTNVAYVFNDHISIHFLVWIYGFATMSHLEKVSTSFLNRGVVWLAFLWTINMLFHIDNCLPYLGSYQVHFPFL